MAKTQAEVLNPKREVEQIFVDQPVEVYYHDKKLIVESTSIIYEEHVIQIQDLGFTLSHVYATDKSTLRVRMVFREGRF